MKTTPRCRNSPISQNQILVNTFSEISPEGYNAQSKEFAFSEISPEGYNAQSKEFVKGFFEKIFCLPQAQNESLVKSILKISFDLSEHIRDGGG